MSEPTPITIDQVCEGDTVRITKECSDGTTAEYVARVAGINGWRLDLVSCGIEFYSDVNQTADVTVRIYLIHRQPTRRAITLDDLKDWRSVPIGSRIELATEPFGKARSGKVTVRRETSESDEGWEFEVGGCWVQFSSIKPNTLFIIEEAKP